MRTHNEEDAIKIAELLGRYRRGELSEQERQAIHHWASQNKLNRTLLEELSSDEQNLQLLAQIEQTDNQQGWQRLYDRMALDKVQPAVWYRRYWLPAVAAAAVLVIGTVLLLFTLRLGHLSKPSSSSIDVPAGTFKAVVYRGNGDSALVGPNDNGQLYVGNTVVDSRKGELIFPKGQPGDNLDIADIRVPLGGHLRVSLADGSKMWLNAGTRVRFATKFSSDARVVILEEGEAYFEVAPDAQRPFSVSASEFSIQALGTAFNVDHYPGYPTRAALASGAVIVEGRKAGRMISFRMSPGQLAFSTPDSIMVGKADLQQTLAWVHNKFLFNDEHLQLVMDQLARWYNLKVQWHPQADRSVVFRAEISRDVPLSELLNLMEKTGIARFKLQGNTLEVLPYP